MGKNKRITKLGSFITVLLVILAFGVVWTMFYNDLAFRTYKTMGIYACVVIFAVIYLWMCSLYKAFAIASTSVGDLVLSHFICYGVADAVLYIICVLLHRDYVNLIPGIICVVVQLVIVFAGMGQTRRLLLKYIVPKKTVVIYGRSYTRDKAESFSQRLLAKYGHLFDIEQMVDEKAGYDNLIKDMETAKEAIFLDVDFELRKKLAAYCINRQMRFYYVPEMEEIIFMSCDTKNLLDTPLKRFNFDAENFDIAVLKRAFDVVLALIFLVILSPFMLLTAIAIKLEDGGPVLFKQLRVTKGERTFYILKFRSMVVDADKHGVQPTTGNDPRITRVGRVIRGIRLDETPQLINILKNDMSFVGPRPERVEHVEKYEKLIPEFRYRHLVKGGLTGYAQVYGKYNTSPEDKLKLDMIYIMNQSLVLDFKLFLLTVRTIFQKESTEGFADDKTA